MNEIQDTHPSFFRENIARIANAAPSLLIKVAMNFLIVVINFQKCDQPPKDHKSLGSLTLSGCSLSVIVLIVIFVLIVLIVIFIIIHLGKI